MKRLSFKANKVEQGGFNDIRILPFNAMLGGLVLFLIPIIGGFFAILISAIPAFFLLKMVEKISENEPFIIKEYTIDKPKIKSQEIVKQSEVKKSKPNFIRPSVMRVSGLKNQTLQSV